MATRIRHMLGGPASMAMVLLMLAGCLFLWVGVPMGWLWIGSQLQAEASLGTALLITMIGILVTVMVVVAALGWVNRRHLELQERRNRPTGSALEAIMVTSAGIAVLGFGVWFFFFAGASPLPLNIGY
jgi:amino acid transporter